MRFLKILFKVRFLFNSLAVITFAFALLGTSQKGTAAEIVSWLPKNAQPRTVEKCSTLFSSAVRPSDIPIRTGKRIADPGKFGLEPGADYWYLGGQMISPGNLIYGPAAGSSTHVIRKISVDGKASILKIFRNAQLFESDRKWFEKLREFQEKGADLGFYIPKIINFEESKLTVEFEDLVGSDGYIVISNENLSVKARTLLSRLLRARVLRFARFLKSTGTEDSAIALSRSSTFFAVPELGAPNQPIEVQTDPGYFRFPGDSQTMGKLRTRPDNILIGPDPNDPSKVRFTLIDPH